MVIFLTFVILLLAVIAYLFFKDVYKKKLSKNLRFFLVKIPKKDSDLDK